MAKEASHETFLRTAALRPLQRQTPERGWKQPEGCGPRGFRFKGHVQGPEPRELPVNWAELRCRAAGLPSMRRRGSTALSAMISRTVCTAQCPKCASESAQNMPRVLQIPGQCFPLFGARLLPRSSDQAKDPVQTETSNSPRREICASGLNEGWSSSASPGKTWPPVAGFTSVGRAVSDRTSSTAFSLKSTPWRRAPASIVSSTDFIVCSPGSFPTQFTTG